MISLKFIFALYIYIELYIMHIYILLWILDITSNKQNSGVWVTRVSQLVENSASYFGRGNTCKQKEAKSLDYFSGLQNLRNKSRPGVGRPNSENFFGCFVICRAVLSTKQDLE